MSKFDQTILEFTGNLPSINPEEITKKLAATVKGLPTNVGNVIAGVGGAIDDATQKNPEEAMLIDKLKDPKSTFTSDDLSKLQKLMQDRGIEFKQETQETPEKQNTTQDQKSPVNKQTEEESPTSYGGKLQGV